jgi:hypothetical protein
MIKLAEEKVRNRESNKRQQGLSDCTIPMALEKYNKAMEAYQAIVPYIQDLLI